MADVTYSELKSMRDQAALVHGFGIIEKYIKTTYGVDSLINLTTDKWNELYLHLKKWAEATNSTALPHEITFQQLEKMKTKICEAGREYRLSTSLLSHFGIADIVAIPHTKWIDLYDIMQKMCCEIDTSRAQEIVSQSRAKAILVNKHRYNARLGGWDLIRTVETTTEHWAAAAVKNTVVSEVYRYVTDQEGKTLVIDSINSSLFD